MTNPFVIPDPGRYLIPGDMPLPARLKLPDHPFDQADTLVIDATTLAAAQSRHPIGFNVRPGVDYAKLLVQVQAMGGCTTMVFHEYAGNLSKLRPFLDWVDIPIWRPAEWVSECLYLDAWEVDNGPQLWVDNRFSEIRGAGFRLDDLWLYLHNEAGWNAVMIDWEALATEHAVIADGHVVCLNPGVGTPEPDQIAMAQSVIELAQRYPEQVLIGLHEYFSVFGNRSAPWYLNRWSFWPEGVRFVITEAGAEDIEDDHPYTSTLPRTGGRNFVGPVHANDAAWAATYATSHKGKDAQYLAELQTAWDVGHWGDPRIAGVCLFSWGAGANWDDYNVAEASAFLEPLAGWRPMATVPIEPGPEDSWVPTLPSEDSSMWKPGRLLTGVDGSNLRLRPFYKKQDGHEPGEILINLKDGAKISVWLEPNYEADGKRWYGVKHVAADGKTHIGWMALTAAKFSDQFVLDEPAPEPDPPVDDDPPPVVVPPDSDETPTLTAADWARLEARFDAIDARLADYDRLIGIILELLSGLQAGENSRSQAVTLSIQEALTQWNTVQTEEVA